MNLTEWRGIRGLKKLLTTRQLEPTRQAERIVAMQLHVVLPAKAGVVAVVLAYLFHSGWLQDQAAETPSAHWIAVELLQRYFAIYVSCNILISVFFILRRRFPPGLFQWIVFTLGLLDGLFMAGLTFITGGFDSIAYWIFPGLIVLNAISIPLATPQIVLNLLLSFFYLGAGIVYVNVPVLEYSIPPAHAFRSPAVAVPRGPRTNQERALPATNRVSRTGPRAGDLFYSVESEENPENPTEPVLPRVFVLWLLTACCYGVQVLAERCSRRSANPPCARRNCTPPADWRPSSRTRSKTRWRSSTTRCSRSSAP